MKPFFRQLKRFPSPLPLIFIFLGTVAVILWGRGYRPDFEDNTIKPTGLLSATSDPVGAQVFIGGELKTATNNPVNVGPGWYDVKISKEGYLPWEKHLRIQGEVVTRTDAFLFPANPSLSPLTGTGVEKPILSPDGTKLAYVVPVSTDTVAQKSGLWVYELVDRPLGLNRDQQQLGISDTIFNFSRSTLTWSPDSTQIMTTDGKSVRLYRTGRLNDFQDISFSYQAVLKDWQETQKTKQLQQLASFKQGVVDIASSSANIIAFSPDETKILYEATASAIFGQIINPGLIGTNSTEEQRNIEPGKLYVYDSREDKNYFVLDKSELPLATPIPSPQKNLAQNKELSSLNFQLSTSIRWFPTNRHLVITLPGKIDIMEYDRTNWVTVYSGPFSEGFIIPWPNASRIIILTNLNPNASKFPNLYTVNLR